MFLEPSGIDNFNGPLCRVQLLTLVKYNADLSTQRSSVHFHVTSLYEARSTYESRVKRRFEIRHFFFHSSSIPPKLIGSEGKDGRRKGVWYSLDILF